MRSFPERCPVNDLGRVRWPACSSSPGEGEVVQTGDAEHRVVDAVALEAAVEDLPGLHPGEDVLDAGSDVLVGLVVFLFPGREFALAALSAVWDDESGAGVAAVGDREGVADGCLRTPNGMILKTFR